MYQLLKDRVTNQIENIVKRTADNAFIPFDPANTDFANFKKEILADEAQLLDADGNVMTDAKAYVKELP